MSESRRWFLGASHLGSYMKRWLLRTPFGTLRIHRIQESDKGRDHHDHPFDFTSLILRGGYIEHRPGCRCDGPGGYNARLIVGYQAPEGQCRFYGPGSIVRRRAEDLHRLELIDGTPALTFVLSGPYRRAWGFQTADGWVGHEEYHRSYYRGDA